MHKQNCVWSAASPQSSLSLCLLWWFGGWPKVIQGNGAPLCLLVWAAVTGRDSLQAAQGCRTAEGCTGKAGGECTRERPRTVPHSSISLRPLPSPWRESGHANVVMGQCRACSVPEEGQGLCGTNWDLRATCTMSPHSTQ